MRTLTAPSEYTKVNSPGRGDGATLGLPHVQRGVDLAAQSFVVGVEAQRKSEAGRCWIDQIERMALVVLVLLQDPRLGLGAAIGEDDAIEVVLDNGLSSVEAGLLAGVGAG